MGPRFRDPVDRFWGLTAPEPNSGCILWMGSVNSGEYPQFAVGRSKAGKMNTVLSHRWIGQTKFGMLPPGYHVHHECENILCVNPDHLAPMDGREHVAMHKQGDGFCPNGHEYAEHGYYRKSGPRAGTVIACKICRRERRRKK